MEEIYSRLVNDTDAVKKEGRFSNNVSSLRPNMKSDYFGNTDTDERSALMPRNNTNVTKVRNTMAPTTSAQHLKINSSSHRAMIPSKTPTLYDHKKRSQPFLNSDSNSSMQLR